MLQLTLKRLHYNPHPRRNTLSANEFVKRIIESFYELHDKLKFFSKRASNPKMGLGRIYIVLEI